jgi:hypothetical protein
LHGSSPAARYRKRAGKEITCFPPDNESMFTSMPELTHGERLRVAP